MKTLSSFIVILLALGLAAGAESDEHCASREVTGTGPTLQTALNNALYLAVGQVRGVKVGTGEYEFGFDSASVGVDRQGTQRSVDFDAVSVQTGGTLTTTQAEGLVKSFQVLEQNKLGDGTYEVKVRVWVYDHKPLDLTWRTRLAVMPINTTAQSYLFGGMSFTAQELSDKLAQRLSAGLSQTGKFAVLDREYAAAFTKERNILLSGDAPLEERARIGEVLGADLMLVGTITDARLEIKPLRSDVTGHNAREYEADFIFDYRIIVAQTRQVKLAETVTIELETDQVMTLVREWEPGNLDFRELADNLIARAANEVVTTVLDRIYPIRIAAIEGDGRVVVNQGGSKLGKGMLLDIFEQGEPIADSDTGELIGSSEKYIGTVRLDKVTVNLSYGKLTAGDASQLAPGLVCRPRELLQKTTGGVKSGIERTPEGGIRMPFDKD